jgi:hypothetical protein
MVLEFEIENGSDDVGSSSFAGFFTNLTALFVGDYSSKTSDLLHSAILFRDLQIPRGTIINSAELIGNDLGSTILSPASFRIYGEDVGNGTIPIDRNDLITKARTESFVTYNIINDAAEDNQLLGDIKDVINEIVSREDWVIGNNITLLFIADIGGDGYVQFASYENETKDAIKLSVDLDIDELTIGEITINSVQSEIAILSAEVLDTGNQAILNRGFEYGLMSGVYTDDITETGSFGTGEFSAEITGLQPGGVTYYARAFTTNSTGTVYTNEVSFTTKKFPNSTNIQNLPTTPTSVTNITI